MSGEGASYQAETLIQPVPSETGTKENRNTGSAVMTMEPERGAKDQTEGEAKKKAHRTGQPKQSVEQVKQEIAECAERCRACRCGGEKICLSGDTGAAKEGIRT